jgi:hypothetical protein
MIFQLITTMHENSLIEEHELIYFWYFLGFLVMKTASLLDYRGNCKLTYLQAYWL